MKQTLMTMVLVTAFAGCIWSSESEKDQAMATFGKNEIRLYTKPLAYEVVCDGQTMVAKTPIAMKFDGICCGDAALVSTKTKKLSGSTDVPIYKKESVDLSGTETYADFGDFGIRLIARKDGVAYRFETKNPATIDNELATFTIPCDASQCWYNRTGLLGCEETVAESGKAGGLKTDDKKSFYLPFVYSVAGKTVAIMESDIYDYPALYFKNVEQTTNGVKLVSCFANYPKATERVGGWGDTRNLKTGGRWLRVRDSEKYLVKSKEARVFPWRVVMLADKPYELCANDIVYALARPQVKGDFSWVKPGKVAWDWWNGFDNLGEEKGCTTAGYKRFIDFAAKTGVEYVIMDEGWSETLNIWKFHPRVDVPEVIRYGNEKGVGIVLWMAWAQIYGEEERVASHFAKLGAKGFKVDFMDRGDADVEGFLWKFADACAKNKVFVDYHGAHRPAGMSRTYPNVLNYEGVHGLEQMKWFNNGYDFMANDVRVFFLRMTAGPMDYTPGAMDNHVIGKYTGNNNNPGSVGTRCHQMAMMAAYEAPFQMLCDSPTKYEKNMECFSFMAAIPVVWADTIGLGGCPDTYAAVARKTKEGKWYAAAINNATGRDCEIDTSFLGKDEWIAEIFRDADACNEKPEQYVHEKMIVKAGEKMKFRMANGGGFIVRFFK